MPTFYLLGAGASYAYTQSPTGLRPPLARGLFATYPRLDISGDIDVKIGTLVNYVRDYYGVPYEQFSSFDVDAEEFMTDLRQRIHEQSAAAAGRPRSPEADLAMLQLGGAYSQTLFLFSHILNEVANGPVSREYTLLARRLERGDTIATFNWDPLLDRALEATIPWHVDDGYDLSFSKIMQDRWRSPNTGAKSNVRLLKLHGSTNWLVNWASFDAQGNRQTLVQDASNSTAFVNVKLGYGRAPLTNLEQVKDLDKVSYRQDVDVKPGIGSISSDSVPLSVYGFQSGKRYFDTWRKRYRSGYEPFTYFLPPNVPGQAIPTMPLLVAPTREKEYDTYASALSAIWDHARRELLGATRIEIIGYSFPRTDARSRELIGVALATGSRVIVVNPYPQSVVEALRSVGFTDDRIEIVPLGFAEYLVKHPI